MLEGRFHHQFLFVPQINGRRRPVGSFVGSRPMVFDKWRTRWSNDYSRDVGFLITRNSNTQRDNLEKTVGYLNATSCDVGANFRAYGYPRPTYGKLIF